MGIVEPRWQDTELIDNLCPIKIMRTKNITS